ncbi:vWA domain-containing protein [Patulibacter minatonensis]|uniref:vWA domain-containing protein n=1 Tax=Patulibacter minatonensis TaxID=298163 RepID=UPI0006869458|nr:VWA domain-containing protein [Patulibacter minatonensis]
MTWQTRRDGHGRVGTAVTPAARAAARPRTIVPGVDGARPADDFDGVLLAFATALRSAGLRVSPSETLDALRAVRAVSLDRRDGVRAALRTTLVKRGRDEDVFDELFARFFLPWSVDPEDDAALRQGHITGLADPDEEQVEDDGSAGAQLGDLFDVESDPDVRTERLDKEDDGFDLSSEDDELTLGGALEGDASGLGQVLNLDRVSDAGEAGGLADDDGDPLEGGFDLAAGVLPSLLQDGEEEERKGMAQVRGGEIDNLAELLRKHLEGFEAEESPEDELPMGLRLDLTHVERVRMDELLGRLSRQLRGAASPRRQPAEHGRIHAARTMRSALRHDGVPVRPATVARKPDRPRLVVLVDLSLSVRNTARFALHLVHGVQQRFDRVRTFAFVDELVDISEQLRDPDPDVALAQMMTRSGLDLDASSDYGRALGTFTTDHLRSVDRRTIVLVLGDGRGNGRPPNVEALEEIGSRCRRLTWLTPEAERNRRLGSCDMDLYTPVCDVVEQVRDLDQLEERAREAFVG